MTSLNASNHMAVELTAEERAWCETQPPLALDSFIEQVGRDPATIRVWREKGFFRTYDICGLQYVTRAEMMIFNRRLAAGEFGRPPKPTPRSSRNLPRAKSKR